MKKSQGPSVDQEEAYRLRQLSKKKDSERVVKDREDRERKEVSRSKMEDIKKAVIKKKNQKSIWDQYSYHIIFGILGVLLLFALFGRAPNETRKLADIQVIEEDFIIKVNSQRRGYTVEANTFFEGWNLHDVKGILKSGFTKKKSVPRCTVTGAELAIDKYNFMEKSPNCVAEIANQGNCSSSFAFAAVGMFNDRLCLANSEQKTFTASTQHPLACDKQSSKGCEGGFLIGALDLGRLVGYVDDQCLPYNPDQADDCPSDTLAKCKRHFVSDYCVLEGVNEIKTTLSASGPVAALIQVTKEFLVYRDGIYDESLSDYKLEGLQAVKVVGFDQTDSGTEYWIVENSWGPSWGKNGYAWVKMNVIDSMLDKFAVSCTTDSEKKDQKAQANQDE